MRTIQRASEAAFDRIEVLSARRVHQIFSATRNFALRERGLRRCSFSPGSTGLVVMRRKVKSGLRLRLGPFRAVEPFAAAIAEEILHDPVFQGMESDHRDAGAGFQARGQNAQSLLPARRARRLLPCATPGKPGSQDDAGRDARRFFRSPCASCNVSWKGPTLRSFTNWLAMRRAAGSSPSSRKRRVRSSSRI